MQDTGATKHNGAVRARIARNDKVAPRRTPQSALRLAAALLLALSMALTSARARCETTLNFWAVSGSVKDVALFDRLAKDFHAKTGVRVKVTPLSWGNFATKYFTAMAAGLPPDIGVTNLGGPTDYGTVGGLVDLRSEFKGEIEEVERRFFPGVLPQFTFGDKLFGLPTDLTTLVMMYRTDLFDKYRITRPRTWSELHETIRQLEEHGFHYYFGWTLGSQWAIGLYTMPYGLPAFQQLPDGKLRVNWLEPDYQKGILNALRLWHTHDMAGRDIGPRVLGMFRSDDPSVAVPLLIDLPFFYSQLPKVAPELNGKWDILPWPKADDGRAFNVMGGTAYVIFRQSKHKREAWEWLKYLNTLEVQRTMILDRLDRGDESGLMISPVRAIWGPENETFWQRPELQSSLPLVRALAEVVPTFDSVPPVRGAVEAGRMEQNLLDRMGSWILDEMSRVGSRHGMGRWQLVQALAQGRLPGEREKLEARIAAKLREEYAAIAPAAQRTLERETAYYKERYGNVIEDLKGYEAKTDVLFATKWLGAGLVLAGCALVLLRKPLRKHAVSYLFIATPIVLAVMFIFVPALTALYLSFTEYHPVLPLSSARWSGLKNYLDVVSTGELFQAIGRSTLYTALTLPIGIAISLVLAFLLNNKLSGERYWRFLFFSPMVTSAVSITLIFTQLFLGSSQGWLNALLLKTGWITDPVPFLHSEKTFLYCVIALAVWHGLAFNILIFLAGLQQIPSTLYEAAAVDGAGTLSRFRSISLPGLRPQLLFIAVLGLIGGFQVFETIYLLAGKAGEAGAKFGPNDSGLTMVPLVYHTGFETFEMGRSSAVAYILFAIIFVFTLAQLRLYRRQGGQE